MQGPDTWIVGVELQHDVSWCAGDGVVAGKNLHVTALRVRRVDDCTVPVSDAISEDPEIVAVEMHGMRRGEMVSDNDPDGCVLAVVVNVPLGVVWIGGVAELGEEENRMVVVGAEGGVVHPPEVVACAVLLEFDVDGGCYGRSELWRELKEWRSLAQSILVTLLEIDVARQGRTQAGSLSWNL